jgi:predicted CopG family antitoxin
MTERIKLRGQRAERFRQLRDRIEAELGYRPSNAGAMGIIMAEFPDEYTGLVEQCYLATRHPNIDSAAVSTLSTRMSNQIRLEDHVYERIKANKRDGESFSDAVERLIGGQSLCDLRDVFDEDRVNEMREAIEAADEADREEVREVAERFE